MRVAQFVINPDVLKLGRKMSSTLFAEIFRKLPKDAVLIDIIAPNYASSTVHFHIESSVFKDIPDGGLLPDILATFRARPDGSAYLESVDWSQALDPSFPNQAMSAAVAAVAVFDPYKHVGEVMYGKITLEEKFVPSCQHELKEYVGIMSRFMYCTKCPYKET